MPAVFDKEVLLNLGFVDLAAWIVNAGALSFNSDHPDSADWLRQANALYAFTIEDDVLYIGKTARSLRVRLRGYFNPPESQATNFRCNGKIRQAISEGHEPRILIFTPITQLQYGGFELNLAAGLEDELIRAFDPAWNGSDPKHRKQRISEDAEREIAEGVEQEVSRADLGVVAKPLDEFEIHLGQTYYSRGFINPGAKASNFLAGHGAAVEISFNDGSAPIASQINRTANRNGTARVVGNNADIARWYQSNFRPGDKVAARIVSRHHIELLAPE